MPKTDSSKQPDSIFPVYSDCEDAVQNAKKRLPITSENELRTVLNSFHLTAIKDKETRH